MTHTEEQTAFALKRAQTGTSVAEATLYVRGAKVEQLLDEAHCGGRVRGGIMIPPELHATFLERLPRSEATTDAVRRFLVHRSGEAFFKAAIDRFPKVLTVPCAISRPYARDLTARMKAKRDACGAAVDRSRWHRPTVRSANLVSAKPAAAHTIGLACETPFPIDSFLMLGHCCGLGRGLERLAPTPSSDTQPQPQRHSRQSLAPPRTHARTPHGPRPIRTRPCTPKTKGQGRTLRPDFTAGMSLCPRPSYIGTL